MRVDFCTGPMRGLIDDVAQYLHKGGQNEDRVAAAKLICDATGGTRTLNWTKARADEQLTILLHWCLENDHYADAAKLCWTESVFTAKPECTRMIWNSIEDHTLVMLMGAASMSKTYGAGVYFFLDWLRDPEYTTVKVVGPSEAHLQDNLFSHLVDLHRSSAIPLPGHIGDLFIGLDMRSRRSSIQGTVIPIGKKAAGRLQGVKRFPRRGGSHPKFGPMSRLRVLMDEVENIPAGIWSDLDNLGANVEGLEGLKIAGAFNPKDPGGHCGQRCEPVDGWNSKDVDRDFEWTSRRGWHVARLDAEQCENVKTGRIVFPGLQTREGVERITQSSGGIKSPNWYTFVRAWFPPTGSSYAVIPSMLLDLSRGTPLWHSRPVKIAGGDIALTGGDHAVLAHGLLGDAVGVQLPPSIRYPKGETIYFKDKDTGEQKIRSMIWLEGLEKLVPGDTYAMAKQLRDLCLRLGIPPENTCFDRTGHGAGVADMLQNIWSPSAYSVNYSERASESKFLVEDLKLASEECDRVVSELWLNLKKSLEFDLLKVAPGLEMTEAFEQMRNRQYTPGGRFKVESKKEYKSRGFRSPDIADAITLFAYAARRVNGKPFQALWKSADAGESEIDEDEMYQRIDITNRHDSL